MKKRKSVSRMVSILTAVVICLMVLPFAPKHLDVFAISCCKDGFDKSRYTLTGNMAEDVATIAKSQKGRTGAQFGYTENWCDEFVADCLENAGADSSIVGHGGTVADFESVMRKKGAVQVSSPQTGDLVFFTYSHVEIVTKVENGVVYCAGGNNGGTGNYKTNYCAGERKLYAAARLYLRPNYPNDTKPDKPILNVISGSSIAETILSWNECANTDYYAIRIYYNGRDEYYLYEEKYYGTNFNIVLPAGKYKANITSISSSGKYTFSDDIIFTVKQSSTLTVVPGNSSTATVFNWSDVLGASEYDVKIWKDALWEGDPYLIEWSIKTNSWETVLPEGTYYAYVDARVGSDICMSNILKFNIEEKISIVGDINLDGKFNISDVVLLQKWLLADLDVKLENWKVADLCEDDKLDVFDLCLMKRMLIEKR